MVAEQANPQSHSRTEASSLPTRELFEQDLGMSQLLDLLAAHKRDEIGGYMVEINATRLEGFDDTTKPI